MWTLTIRAFQNYDLIILFFLIAYTAIVVFSAKSADYITLTLFFVVTEMLALSATLGFRFMGVRGERYLADKYFWGSKMFNNWRQ